MKKEQTSEVLEEAAEKGRKGDTVMAHLTNGEIVLPAIVQQDPEFMQMLSVYFKENDADINQYIVGSEANSINPETGVPEFGFWKSVKKAFKFVAPVALSVLAPGLGTAIGTALGATGATAAGLGGAVLGAGTGALTGGGLKGALLGAAGGGLGGAVSGGSTLGGAIPKGALSSTQTAALGGALTGAGAGAASGGLKGALLGAATGGAGGYYNAGGFDGTLNSVGLGGSGAGSLSSGQVDVLNSVKPGNYATAPVSLGGSGMGGNLFNLNNASSLFSGIGQYQANDDAAKALREAQGRVEDVLAPYNQTGQAVNEQLASELQSGQLGGTFNPGDLTQDPGYQFRLQQGTEALNRTLAAQGMGSSGAAIKAAQEYGQGLADQTYNDAYNRWLQQQGQRYNMLSGQSGQGLRAAGAIGSVYDTMGDINANKSVNQSNILTGALSSILSGAGALKVIGQDMYGNPIYGRA